jgi:hypothetical protein
MDEVLKRQTELKAWAIKSVRRFLDRLEAEKREPDAWELDRLVMAIESLRDGFGNYMLACKEIILAVTPVGERAPYSDPSASTQYNIESMRKLLSEAEAMEVSAKGRKPSA